MKWLWVVLGLTAIMVTWTIVKPLDQAPAGLNTPTSAPTVLAEREPEDSENQPDAARIPSPASGAEAADEPRVDDEDRVINIGEPMDPDDPSTWPQSENTEVINIGEPMDPDDPSTWPQSENTEVINIGEPMDPDDPSIWLQPENNEVINIGEPMDPDDPYTWPQSENTEVINIGEPMDPDDPSTWN